MQCTGNKQRCIDIVNAMMDKRYIQQAVSCQASEKVTCSACLWKNHSYPEHISNIKFIFAPARKKTFCEF